MRAAGINLKFIRPARGLEIAFPRRERFSCREMADIPAADQVLAQSPTANANQVAPRREPSPLVACVPMRRRSYCRIFVWTTTRVVWTQLCRSRMQIRGQRGMAPPGPETNAGRANMRPPPMRRHPYFHSTLPYLSRHPQPHMSRYAVGARRKNNWAGRCCDCAAFRSSMMFPASTVSPG